MNKTEFMNRLKQKLARLPHEEYISAIDFYEQYFEESEDEAKAIAGLGSPEAAAVGILANYVGTYEKKTTGRKIWTVILTIFAAPIALPLAMALCIVAISIVFSIAVTVFALALSGIASIIGGIIGAILGFFFIMQNPASTLLFVGLGMLSTAIGVSLLSFAIWAGKNGFTSFLNLWSKILRGYSK